MPVFRVEKNANYTTMSNYHLRDTGISLKAKGLLSMCLSLTESWDYSVNGLAAISKEGRDAVLSAVRELEQAGYISREQLRRPDGTMGHSEYVIREIPAQASLTTEIPAAKKPMPDKPTTVSPARAKSLPKNPAQLSTDSLSTEEIKYGEKKEPRHRHGAYQNVLLTDVEFQTLCREFPMDYQQRIERLSEYVASTGKSYKNHLATIRSWARKDKAAASAQGGYGKPGYYDFEEGDSL